MKSPTASNVDEYISGYPADVRIVLEDIRRTVREAVPEAEETIRYGMPTYLLNGHLVYFAGYARHVGFYPAPRNHPTFEEELAPYASGRGTLKFPLNRPVPLDLIRRLTLY